MSQHEYLTPSIVISAPFGNYLRRAGCYSTLGTYTLDARPGRIRQILRIVRFAGDIYPGGYPLLGRSFQPESQRTNAMKITVEEAKTLRQKYIDKAMEAAKKSLPERMIVIYGEIRNAADKGEDNVMVRVSSPTLCELVVHRLEAEEFKVISDETDQGINELYIYGW